MNPTDPMTGLPGGAAWRSDLDLRVRAGEPFSLLLLDIDGFKAVNGAVAHERGNWLLRRAGQEVAAASPAAAMVYRAGADEFAVLVPIIAARVVADLGERICAAVAAIEIPGWDGADPGPPHVSCSVGVARYPADGQATLDLVGVADRWVFIAKHMGGGRVAFDDEEIIARLTEPRSGLTNHP